MKNHSQSQMFENAKANKIGWFLTGVLITLIVSMVTLSLVPPISKDALVHHLAVPKLYLKHGGMYEIPFMPFSYYPMNLDLLFLIPLYLGNDIVPKFIHFCFALLTAWLIFDYLRRRANSTYALFGAIFFLSIPIVVKLSVTVYVDLGVMFFSTSSLLLLLKWIESGFRLRFLTVSALMCGLALGTKYNALVTFFLLTLFVPYFYSRYAKGKRPGFFKSAGQGAIFFIIALLVFSPWMIRNYHWKSNPIYPLYDRWFNPPKVFSGDVSAQKAAESSKSGPFAFRKVIYQERWWEIALLPIRIFFQGKDGSPQYFDGKLNPFLLFLPIFAFYRTREGPLELRREKKIMLAFSVLFFAFALFGFALRIRYISPIIPPLVILSVMGIKNIGDRVQHGISRKGGRLGVLAVLVISAAVLFYNAVYIVQQFHYVKPFSYLGGDLSRDEYIANYRPEYPAMQYLNRHLPTDSLVLFVFLGNRGYYCDREYRFGENLFGQLIARSNRPEEILVGLSEVGATHLFIYFPLFEKWMNHNFGTEKYHLVNYFISKYTRMMYNDKGFSILFLPNVAS
ncbi:MAG: glycosyltransferase family 39 protein [Desulfobacteraceae bacterium]